MKINQSRFLPDSVVMNQIMGDILDKSTKKLPIRFFFQCDDSLFAKTGLVLAHSWADLVSQLVLRYKVAMLLLLNWFATLKCCTTIVTILVIENFKG